MCVGVATCTQYHAGFARPPQGVGLTTELPNPTNVPPFLHSGVVGLHDWVYKCQAIYHDNKFSKLPDIPRLDNLTPGQSVGLLATLNGQLHVFVDGIHRGEIATGLPVDTPLWGMADVCGRCTKIKSEIMSGESSGVVILPSQCVGELD